MKKYNDDIINILVRDALALENKKKFEEALEIYEELALQGVEYAIDRIPIAKHRLDNYKLRRINYFMSIVTACAIGTSIVIISFNTALSVFKSSNLRTSFAFYQVNTKGENSTYKTDIQFKTIEEYSTKESDFNIVVPKNITQKKLSERALEAIDTYSMSVNIGEKLIINIHSSVKGNLKNIGYIKFDTNKPQICTIYTYKGI